MGNNEVGLLIIFYRLLSYKIKISNIIIIQYCNINTVINNKKIIINFLFVVLLLYLLLVII